MRYSFLIFAQILAFLCSMILAYKLKIILNYMQENVNFSVALAIQTIGQISSYLTPLNLGVIVIRPLIGKKLGNISPRKVIFATLFDQWFELFIQLILFLLLLISGMTLILNIQIEYNWIYFLFLFLTLFFAVIVSKPEPFIKFALKFIPLLPSFFKKRLKGENVLLIVEKVKEYQLFNKNKLSYLFFLYLIFILLYPTILLALVKSFNAHLTYFTSFILIWLSYILGRVSGIPGGYGVRDLSLGAMLILQGVESTTAILVVSIYRIITLIPSFALGISFYFYNKYYSSASQVQ